MTAHGSANATATAFFSFDTEKDGSHARMVYLRPTAPRPSFMLLGGLRLPHSVLGSFKATVRICRRQCGRKDVSRIAPDVSAEADREIFHKASPRKRDPMTLSGLLS
jgi:hypothetical protein